ncbi:MAG: hypothetical protein GXX08_07570 [Firmicutes bacterium]|nr:hypothetical protein [Bacillota bacterium]
MGLVVALALSALTLPVAAGWGQNDESSSSQLVTSFLSGIFINWQRAYRSDSITGSFGNARGIITVQQASGNGNIVQHNGRVSLQRSSAVDLAATTAVYCGGLELSADSWCKDLWFKAGPIVVDKACAPRADLICGAFNDACGIITVQQASGNANTLSSIGNVLVSTGCSR